MFRTQRLAAHEPQHTSHPRQRAAIDAVSVVLAPRYLQQRIERWLLPCSADKSQTELKALLILEVNALYADVFESAICSRLQGLHIHAPAPWSADSIHAERSHSTAYVHHTPQ